MYYQTGKLKIKFRKDVNNMGRKKKIFFIIAILIFIIILLITNSYGFSVDDLTGTEQEITTLKNAGNSIIKVISTAGVVISVAVLIILGIKYMMGSVEERAEYKKTLMPYVIGAALVFAASGIAQIVYNIANSL